MQAARDVERDAAAAPPPAERVRCAAAERAALQRAEQVAALRSKPNHLPKNAAYFLQLLGSWLAALHSVRSCSVEVQRLCSSSKQIQSKLTDQQGAHLRHCKVMPRSAQVEAGCRLGHTPMYSMTSMGGWDSRHAP